jgi:hypothetical protein
MAKPVASDAIMTPDKMKPLLALSKTEPVQAAIGLTSDGEGLILLDKKAKPRKALSLLRGNAAKAKLALNTASLRFGRAEVDLDYDPAMVRFFINKDAPGNMRVKLLEVVKRIPYQKVEINVDPSLEAEEDDADETETASAAPATASANGLEEAEALGHSLADLIGRIPAAAGSDPARKAKLAQVAGAANGLIKASDWAGARKLLAGLEQAMAAAPPPAAAGGAPDLLALFRDAKEDVDSGLTKLQAALRATDDIDMIRIAEYGLYGMTNGTGTGLMKVLMDLHAAPPDRAAPLRDTARAAAAAYKAALFNHPLADLVDANPFGVVVGVKAKLGPVLERIAAA